VFVLGCLVYSQGLLCGLVVSVGEYADKLEATLHGRHHPQLGYLSPSSLMAHQPAAAAAYGDHDHGLRFLNDEWNDSISNGDPFTLRWNQSLAKAGAELGLFKVIYPADGVIVYDLVANLTGVYPDRFPWTLRLTD
jgi:hypothetical protein